MMTITCLLENTAATPDVEAEHGLSLYIETGDRHILFDMGQTDAFARNAAQMGIDLAGVDAAILSHGHYDHGGGMARFLALNNHAPVYHSSRAFGGHYHGEKYIGLDRALQANNRLIPVEDEMYLGDGLSIHGCQGWPLKHPIQSGGLSVQQDSAQVPEQFAHEQYLLMQQGDRRILISGCSHRGVANIVAWFKPDVLVGGFHLMKLDPDAAQDRRQLEALAEELASSGATFYTGHCTGEKAYAFLKERMGERLHYLRTGETIKL